MIDDLTVLHQINKDTASEEMTLFKPKDSYRMQGRAGKPSPTKGTNLPNGVIVYFNLRDYDTTKDSIQLHFKDSDGKLIKTFSTQSKEEALTVKVGGNQFVWDTRYEGAERLDGMIFWSASFSGAKAVPGDYKVVLEKNGVEVERAFTILPDPRSEATVSDMKRQFDFVNQVNATVDKAHKAIKNIRKINKKLSNFEENYGDLEETQALLSQVKELKKKFSEVEKALYQTKNRSNQDPLNFPIRLTNKLGHLNRLVTINDFPPTDQDEAVRSYLTSEVEKHLSIYQQMIDQDLEDFNTAFAKLNLDYLTVN
jgi:hypothetical protein